MAWIVLTGFLVLASVVLAVRGSWWPAALPAGICTTGGLLLLLTDEAGRYETNEYYLLGAILATVGGIWLVIVVLARLVAGPHRGHDAERPTP